MLDRNQAILDSKKSVQEKLLGKLFNANERLAIFDIGACEGSESIRYAKMFPGSTVYAIEPLPYNVEHIKANVTNHNAQNVRYFETCFSNKPGVAEFYVSSGNPTGTPTDWDYGNKSSSLFPPDQSLSVFPWLKFKDKIEVPTTTVDDFCREHSIPVIHFIHMDVQGAELLVLEGARKMLKNTCCIWLEVENIPLYKGQPLKDDVEQFFIKNGFSKLLDTVGKVAGDQFWMNNDFSSKNKATVVFLIKLINRLPRRFSKRMLESYLTDNS